MANLGDIAIRTEALCKKYDKYVVVELKDRGQNGPKNKGKADIFSETYEKVFHDVQALSERAESISAEKNRAAIAEANAQLRRAKQAILQDDIPKLQKLLKKGRDVTRDIVKEREQLIAKLIEACNEVPDGVHGVRRPLRPSSSTATTSGGRQKEVIIGGFDSDNTFHNPSYYEQTDESQGFRQTWDTAREKQDKTLDEIAERLGQLKEMGEAMGEELDRQDPLVNNLELQVDRINEDMSSNNKKLKNTVHKIRSGRRVCIDIVLVLVLLMVLYWIYSALRQGGVV
mmetsp:Transcript_33638/g.79844  ORF Transcript_33638/g.79844 Transcript_33638/m.79844 type:complete len:286 (-) Transcript_33638:56-913(-)